MNVAVALALFFHPEGIILVDSAFAVAAEIVICAGDSVVGKLILLDTDFFYELDVLLHFLISFLFSFSFVLSGFIIATWFFPPGILMVSYKNPHKLLSARADGLGKKIGGAGDMRRKRGQPPQVESRYRVLEKCISSLLLLEWELL